MLGCATGVIAVIAVITKVIAVIAVITMITVVATIARIPLGSNVQVLVVGCGGCHPFPMLSADVGKSVVDTLTLASDLPKQDPNKSHVMSKVTDVAAATV